MNKQQMIDAVAEETGQSKASVREVIEAFGLVAQQAMHEGQDVTLAGLGKLKPVEKAARTGRNPATGEPVHIEAKRVAKFAPSAELKAAIN